MFRCYLWRWYLLVEGSRQSVKILGMWVLQAEEIAQRTTLKWKFSRPHLLRESHSSYFKWCWTLLLLDLLCKSISPLGMFAVCESPGSGIAYYQIWNLINKEPLQRRRYEKVGHKDFRVSSPWELAWRGGTEKCFFLGEQVIAQRREKMPRAASPRSLNGSARRWRVSPLLPV